MTSIGHEMDEEVVEAAVRNFRYAAVHNIDNYCPFLYAIGDLLDE